MNHIPPYLFLSREDDDDVRDIGKHDFRSVLIHPMLSNANRGRHFKIQVRSIRDDRIHLFSLYVLFSHSRPRDATLGNSLMHVQMYA